MLRIRRWTLAVLGALLLCPPLGLAQPPPEPSEAPPVDYAEYERLSQRANALLESVREASPEALGGLREAAVRADLDVLEWLDAFIESDVFSRLPPEQQQAARSDRYRWEYNLSVQLIGLERCYEASDRLEALFRSAITDEALRPRLSESFEEALACVARLEGPQPTSVTVRSSVPGAEVLLDGQYVGPAPATFELAPGPYVVTVRAEGYEDRDVAFEATGATTIVGPVDLARVVVPEPNDGPRPPNWGEWTLWGVGVAGVASSVGLYVTARNREDTIEENPGRVLDPEAERDTIDRLDLAAYVLGGVGLAAAITGTVLYLVGRDDGEETSDGELALDRGFAIDLTGWGVTVTVGF